MVPGKLKELIEEFVKKVELNYAVFDLKCNEKFSDFIFLECNPWGQVGNIGYYNGFNPNQKIADALMRRVRYGKEKK